MFLRTFIFIIVGAQIVERLANLLFLQEYNACDGAHEPGRSYGGACANSMLKVLYDAANDTMDTNHQEAVASSLFDDDDDEGTDDGLSSMAKSFKSGFSLDNGTMTATTLTWADLLRKMKAEMKEIEYAQTPKITTTRKIDLNKPFSLLPDDFDPSKNKKRALLIGCNYKNIPGAELKASHDDIRSMKVSIRYGGVVSLLCFTISAHKLNFPRITS